MWEYKHGFLPTCFWEQYGKVFLSWRKTCFTVWDAGKGPKYLFFLFSSRREVVTFGYSSRVVTFIYSGYLSSFAEALYLGRCFLISSASKRSASSSENTGIHEMLDAAFANLELFVSFARRCEITRSLMFMLLPT